MKILHSADFHLDSPFTGKTPQQASYLREQLLKIPEKLTELCLKEGCQIMLLSGDLFDGKWTMESFRALRDALEQCKVPVFISPGNHDYVNQSSPYVTQVWPDNVHIFKVPSVESVYLRELDCRVYGAGFRSMDCRGLLKNFRKEHNAKYHIGVFHGDPIQPGSPCCPVTAGEIGASGLDYLALGHIHKSGSIRKGRTLCAWPGSPMGRGFDETGTRGALVVDLQKTAEAKFVPLNTPVFYDEESTVEALEELLPGYHSMDFFRITLTGEGKKPTVEEIAARYRFLPNLLLRDRRTEATPLWGNAGADTLEGVYFQILQDALEGADEQTRQVIELSAKISKEILQGQEVVLP